MQTLEFVEKLRSYIQHSEFDLISLDIPHAVGNSFFELLMGIYGHAGVLKLDPDQKGAFILPNRKSLRGDKIQPTVKAVHANFSLISVLQSIEYKNHENLPYITWIRDPVELVVSNYNYLAAELAEKLKEKEKDLDILSKIQRNLLEYARLPESRNIMSRHIGGHKLDKFFFVGIQEHYEEDLTHLARRFGWPKEKVHAPTTKNRSEDISKEQREIITDLNAHDVHLYEHALALKKRRT